MIFKPVDINLFEIERYSFDLFPIYVSELDKLLIYTRIRVTMELIIEPYVIFGLLINNDLIDKISDLYDIELLDDSRIYENF